MRHNYVSDDLAGAHWAVGESSGKGLILVQVQDTDGIQARVAMSPEHARAMANELLDKARRLETQKAMVEAS